MRKFDSAILALGIIVTILWTIVAGKDGFKGNNATIVARSIAITATIDGQIENNPPPVGTWVNSNDLLARVHNRRFDRSRLMELESQSANLRAEIDNIAQQLESIELLRSQFVQRATAHAEWVVSDLELKHEEFKAQLDVARAKSRLESKEARRAQELYGKNLISQVEMEIASTQAEIAGKQLDVNKAQWERSGLMLHTWKKSGVLLEDGDASYWDKMTDTLRVQHFESRNRLAMLESQLIQTETQTQVEKSRITSSFVEEHHAPFAGKVNARFVTQSTRVNSGTDLLQILDCTNPVVIIPVPDHRISDFSVGLGVTIYPIDSDQPIEGKIEYISSGPMIGSDTSIQIQQEFTLAGNRAIVSLNETDDSRDSMQSCETARKAVAVIHTPSIMDSFTNWLKT